MITFFTTLLMAPPSGQPGQPAANPILQFAPLILIAAVFYFMILRPQKKRQKEKAELVNRMEKGDKVVTSSGIHGTVDTIEDTTILVKVSDATKIRFEKSAVNIVNPKNVTTPAKIEASV